MYRMRRGGVEEDGGKYACKVWVGIVIVVRVYWFEMRVVLGFSEA